MSRYLPIFAGCLLISLCFPCASDGCIWVEGSTIDGKPKGNNATSLEFFLRGLNETPASKLDSVVHSSSDGEFTKREKEAVKKMLSGVPAEAIPLLLQNEQWSPNQYSTAANLGTAYELAGDNSNALMWINEGIRRNSKSHNGTEWLHVLILETKLRLEREPDYLKTHRIIPLPEKFDAETEIDIAGAERSIGEIVQALNYQLGERAIFVKPPDSIVADLLYTYALCEAHTGVLENALKLLKKSQEYGFAEPGLIKSTEDRYQALIHKAEKRREFGKLAINAGFVLAFAGSLFGFVVWRRRRWARRTGAKAKL